MEHKSEEQINQRNRRAGTSLRMLNMAVSIAIGLVYTPFVLRSLGSSEYGVYSLANSVISFLSILDLGLGSALVRFTARARAEGKDEKNINGAFLLFYTVIAAVALAVGIFLELNIDTFFAGSFTPQELKILQSVFFVLLINTVLTFPASVFSSVIASHEKFAFAGIVNLLSNLLRHGVICLFLWFGFRSLTMAAISLCVNLLVWGLNIGFCFRKLKIKIGFQKLEKRFYLDILRYSFFILINILVDRLYASTDNVILGKVCGSVAVAVYGIGVTFEIYFQQMSTAVANVFFSHISKLSVQKDGIKAMSKTFNSVGHVQMVLLGYVLMGFAAYGKEFISLWVGPGYEDAYFIALIIMVPAMIPLSQNIGISVLRALNKHSVRSLMYLAIAILNVGVSIPLAMQLEGVGAALGTAFGNLLGQILFMNWYYHRIGLDIPQYWKNFAVFLVRSLPVLAVFGLFARLPLSGWSGLILKIAAAQVITLPYCCFALLNPDEKQTVGGILARLKRR